MTTTETAQPQDVIRIAVDIDVYHMADPDRVADTIRQAAEYAFGDEAVVGVEEIAEPSVTPPAGQPATPAEALRQCVALFDPGPLGPDATEATVEVRKIAEMMSRWADELDAAPAADSDLRETVAYLVFRAVDIGDSSRAAALEVADQILTRAARATVPGPAAPTTYALPAEPPPEVTELWWEDGTCWDRRDGLWWRRDGRKYERQYPTAWAELLAYSRPLSSVPPAGTGADQ